MRPKLPHLALAVVLTTAGTGCFTMGTMTTASALPQGETQINLEPNLWGGTGLTFPTFNVSGRYGVTDRFELGGRAGLGGFELLTKFQLTPPASDFVISLAPSGGGVVLGGEDAGSAGLLSVNLPVLFGFRSTAGELVVGPKLHGVTYFVDTATSEGGDGASLSLLSVGGTVGYAFRMGELVLMPELAVLAPVYGSAEASVDGDSGTIRDYVFGSTVLMQLSFAMMFGG